MTKLTSEQFKDLCRGVQDARASLDSCIDREAPSEAERLLRLVVGLRGAAPMRASRALEKLRDDTIYSAMLSHARRG
jgi:hypothetical protein